MNVQDVDSILSNFGSPRTISISCQSYGAFYPLPIFSTNLSPPAENSLGSSSPSLRHPSRLDRDSLTAGFDSLHGGAIAAKCLHRYPVAHKQKTVRSSPDYYNGCSAATCAGSCVRNGPHRRRHGPDGETRSTMSSFSNSRRRARSRPCWCEDVALG